MYHEVPSSIKAKCLFCRYKVLFQSSSMHNTIDATAEGQGPIKNYNQHMAIYYVVFVVIFTFMIINIYIALIILTFQRQGEKEIEGGLDRNQVGNTFSMQKILGIQRVFTLRSFCLKTERLAPIFSLRNWKVSPEVCGKIRTSSLAFGIGPDCLLMCVPWYYYVENKNWSYLLT